MFPIAERAASNLCVTLNCVKNESRPVTIELSAAGTLASDPSNDASALASFLHSHVRYLTPVGTFVNSSYKTTDLKISLIVKPTLYSDRYSTLKH